MQPETQPSTSSEPQMSDLSSRPLYPLDMALEAIKQNRPLMFTGPAHEGFVMFARRLAYCLPELDIKSRNTVRATYGAAGLQPPRHGRAFRAPHHTTTEQGILGRCDNWRWRPGELSLAHRGILFLDDFQEFRTHTRNIINIRRDATTVAVGNNRNHHGGTFPADPALTIAWVDTRATNAGRVVLEAKASDWLVSEWPGHDTNMDCIWPRNSDLVNDFASALEQGGRE